MAVSADGCTRTSPIWGDKFPDGLNERVVLCDAHADSCPLVAQASIDFNARHRSLALHSRSTAYPTDGTTLIGYGCSNMYDGCGILFFGAASV